MHLERYLLSLYRKAFQQHVPSILGNHAQQMNEIYPWTISDRPSQKMKLEMSKDYSDHQEQSSPTSALAGPDDLVQVATPRSSSERVVCLISSFGQK